MRFLAVVGAVCALLVFVLPVGARSSAGVFEGASFTCSAAIDYDLVKLTGPSSDALKVRSGCSGRIGRLEIDTWTADGVKVQQGSGAHDLVVESGYIVCHAQSAGAHQDGIQAMGGQRLTFTLDIQCGPQANAQFFVSSAAAADIVCDGCFLGGGAAHTALVSGVRSGVRNSVVCPDRTPFGGWLDGGSQSKVNENNVLLSADDPGCVG